MPRPVPVAAASLCAALAVVLFAMPAGAAKKPPVKLSGTVNNEGVVKAVAGAATIEAGSFFFEKTFVKAPAGPVEITIENGSSTPHTFTVDDQRIDEQLAPGATKTVTVDVTDGTPVTFYCRFHRGSGMQGAVFTKKGGTAKALPSRNDGYGGYGY